jgi:lipoprotein-releasing system ATP-binding protein
MGVSVAVRGVTRHYEKGGARIEVLRGAELELAAGDSVAIVGQSGSGKSTFLHLLGGLERPTAGSVEIDGASLYARPAPALDTYRNRSVGFIFQFHHLLPDHAAIDNVAIPALVARMPRDQARTLAREALGRVGLAHRLEHKPGELSGGEQQRVAIARALLLSPGLVLADEPTGNLDPRTADEVMTLLLDLNRAQGATLVVVTHSMELARRFPRVVRVVDGGFAEAA